MDLKKYVQYKYILQNRVSKILRQRTFIGNYLDDENLLFKYGHNNRYLKNSSKCSCFKFKHERNDNLLTSMSFPTVR